jgi:DNA-directed RNA polymerase subunit RPC12/RpoP
VKSAITRRHLTTHPRAAVLTKVVRKSHAGHLITECPQCGSTRLVPITPVTVSGQDAEVTDRDEPVGAVAKCSDCGSRIYPDSED